MPADSKILPRAGVPVLLAGGICSQDWYRFFQQLARDSVTTGEQQTVINRITQILDGEGAFLPTSTRLIQGEGIALTGTLANGVVTVSLQQVQQQDGGAIRRITIDGYGRVVESGDASTDDLPEGSDNLYFTDERAQAAVSMVYNRIDVDGYLRIDADGNLRISR